LSSRPVAGDFHLGASCHNAAELQQAAKLGADFVVLGPVQPTASHPGGPTIGWERFTALCASVSLPVYAIGGMRAADLPQALQGGARGLAMIRGGWESADFASVVHQLSG